MEKTDIKKYLDSRKEDESNGPVRLCCGHRHIGPICPDGKVMCCLCFTRVSQDQLKLLPNGMKEDVCLTCAESEDKLKDNASP